MRANTIALFMFSAFTLVFLLSACTQNLGGKAADSAPYCPYGAAEGTRCGDNSCNGCETCSSCYQDCCPNVCDENDGGDNAVQKGSINGIYRGEAFTYNDACQNNENLMEYYCGTKDFNIPTNKRFACSTIDEGYTCVGGECVEIQKPQ
ncbi:MAG: hypothetical protein V1743_02900 [Nanoarchaeota archaeon]